MGMNNRNIVGDAVRMLLTQAQYLAMTRAAANKPVMPKKPPPGTPLQLIRRTPPADPVEPKPLTPEQIAAQAKRDRKAARIRDSIKT